MRGQRGRPEKAIRICGRIHHRNPRTDLPFRTQSRSYAVSLPDWKRRLQRQLPSMLCGGRSIQSSHQITSLLDFPWSLLLVRFIERQVELILHANKLDSNGGFGMSTGSTAPDSDNISALADIVGQKLPVLDDGFVRLVDCMGDDSSIVQAARVSYGKGTKKVSEDRGLIRYLIRHRHTTPFEMCEIKLHVRVPMDCWRQWIRHRTANVNEYSTRYSIAIDAAKSTKPDEWRLQGFINRQGSEGELDRSEGERLSDRESEFHKLSREVYQDRLDAGVAREQARKDLPLATYTEAYWKIDLHNLLHFLALRMEGHAQYEIREYANVIGHQIVAKWVPLAWEAFLDYRLNAMGLSDMEIRLLSLLYSGKQQEAISWMQERGWLKEAEGDWKLNIEANEFANKLTRLQIDFPWA